MPKKLWGGRFQKKADPLFEQFSSSFRWDHRLLPHDLAINKAHVRALARCGVLSAGEAGKLRSALSRLETLYQKGRLTLPADAEDVHSAVHAAIRKTAGPAADKLHTGRSRNDLVSQSARLYCKTHALTLLSLVRDVQRRLTEKADQYQHVLIPGMTHLQNAQVVSMAHVFLSYVEMLERAHDRLFTACRFADVCVLGSGALAGTTFRLDQARMARELGLSAVTRNSYDVSGDRDFVLSLLGAILSLGTALSRIAEDLMYYQTKSVSLIDLDESLCTGSSMMPQKKNADFLELTRGAAGIFAGAFNGFAVTLKGLPTSYNRDLQWDKSFLFASVETGEAILRIFARLIKTLKVMPDKARSYLSDESLYATDLADYLVQKGVPFSQAHEQTGKIVRFSEEIRLPVSRIGLDLLKRFAPKADGGLYELFDPKHSVRMKKTAGSTHPAQVRKQIARWKRTLR